MVMVEVAVRRRRRGRLAAAAAVLVTSGLSACSASRTEADDKIEAVGAAYVAVLDRVLPELEPVDDDSLPVLFLWEFSEVPMSLDDQVVVIDEFDDDFNVQFVDQFDAAVDPDLPAIPPRADGLLIGLGPITVDAPHTIRVEFYENADLTSAILVTLMVTDGTWTVTDEEAVEPEAFNAVA